MFGNHRLAPQITFGALSCVNGQQRTSRPSQFGRIGDSIVQPTVMPTSNTPSTQQCGDINRRPNASGQSGHVDGDLHRMLSGYGTFPEVALEILV